MKPSDLQVFRCPSCNTVGRWEVAGSATRDGDEIVEASIRCGGCGATCPVIRSIPRFVPPENYASSFGYQWNKFAKTQVGGEQTKISKVRFDDTTGWPHDLRGQLVLEAGCGAGRFTGIVLATGAEVYSFDLSLAVEANLGNVTDPEQKSRLHLFQASIYDIPLPEGMLDKVYCLGVLQHTPDVKAAYMSLTRLLKPGGELVIDCYLSQPLKHCFNLKYLLRPFFYWWKPEPLFRFWKAVISVAFDVKRLLNSIPVVGRHVARVVPIGRLSYEPEHDFSLAELKEIKTLSVYDMLSPRYDQPQKLATFEQWMKEAGLEMLELKTGFNGINAKARRPTGVRS